MRSSGPPGWRGLPEAAGFEAHAGQTGRGGVVAQERKPSVSGCRREKWVKVLKQNRKREISGMFGLTNARSTGARTTAATTSGSWGGNKRAWRWTVPSVECGDSSCKHTGCIRKSRRLFVGYLCHFSCSCGLKDHFLQMPQRRPASHRRPGQHTNITQTKMGQKQQQNSYSPSKTAAT